MIPLVLCRAYGQEDFATAAAIAGSMIVFGWLVARRTEPFWIYLCCLIGLLMPSAALLGFWPFNPSWRYDCGATPDPAILTIGASALSPLLLGAAHIASRRLDPSRRPPS